MRERTKEDSGFVGLFYTVARGIGKIKKELKIDDAYVNTNICSYMCIYLHIADSPRL